MSGSPLLQPERELRLAVVMYGGVSLAIYMNGVAQELLQLVRATARDPKDLERALFADADLDGTSALVYRQLARLSVDRPAASRPAASPSQAPEDPAAPIRQRFVVDILSGTSAGGINGVFLAKALANGQSLDGLARLWQSEADLGRLINDGPSREGVPKLPSTRHPKSLLNSQRMYRELVKAFDAMDGSPDDPATRPAGPLVDEVGLFVTATDLEGLPLRLQLGGGEIAEERQHRKSFHLSYGPHGNDFEAADNPFLAFVSRCTSSFPVAFEPMQFSAARRLLHALRRPLDADGIPARWEKHFAEFAASGAARTAREARAFADGGYLDNKPFSHAIDAISRRRGGDSGRVERKLVYIEPDPERLSIRQPDETEPPNAIENALAVVELRSYETIREELLRLRDRNRLVDKIRSVVAGVDSDFEALGDEARGRLAAIIAQRDEFGERALDQVVQVFGSAYGGYHRLKVGQLTDELSEAVASHACVVLASGEFSAIRMLVRAWRNSRYSPNPAVSDSPAYGADSEFKFLAAFDLSYRIRRASFVIDQINRLRVLTPEELAQSLGQHPSIGGGSVAAAIAAEVPDDLGRAFDALRLDLAAVVRDLRTARDELLAPQPGQALPAIAAHAADVREAAAMIMAQPTDRQRRRLVDALVRPEPGHPAYEMLGAMQAVLEVEVQKASHAARTACEALLQTDSTPQLRRPVLATPEDVVRYIGRHYYTWYELYDSMVFPIVHGTEVGEEIAPVEPIRISPLTRREPGGLPVAPAELQPSGNAVGHFGAFLHEQWRARDILIGRLNAAEKLVRMALTGTPHDQPETIRAFVRRAHSAILEQECRQTGSLIGAALARVHGATTPEARLAHVERNGLPAEDLPSERTAGWIARAARVMGRVLREASERPSVRKLAAALLYAGSVLTGMVEVIVPKSWWGVVLRLWIPRLVLFAIALVLLGSLLGREQVTSLGWTLLAVIAVFGALTLVLRAWIQARWSLAVRILASLLALVVVGLLAIGVLYAPAAWADLRAGIVNLSARLAD